MLSTFKSTLAALTLTNSVQGYLAPGKCPDRATVKPHKEFAPDMFNGIWYEYVWDEPFVFYYYYKCSMWLF